MGENKAGRKKGTPNKVSAMSKKVISCLLTDYSASGLMASDFMALEPRDRLAVSEKFLNYIMPKMQATSVELSTSNESKSIEDKLSELAGENDV